MFFFFFLSPTTKKKKKIGEDKRGKNTKKKKKKCRIIIINCVCYSEKCIKVNMKERKVTYEGKGRIDSEGKKKNK